MVKKKGKPLPAPEPEEAEPTCKHIRKGLEEGAVKKALANVNWTQCQDCSAETRDRTSEEQENEAEGDVIWICLKCGHRGCGRYSKKQHALNHYNTPRSEPHCLVLSIGDWTVWCYLCDIEVHYSSSGRLRQLVDFIQRMSKINAKVLKKVLPTQDDLPVETKQEKDDRQKIDDPNRPAKGDNPASYPNDGKEVTVKGLSNLGNTCFFNAVMQNLSQTPTLRELLHEVKCPGKAITVQVPADSQPRLQEVKLEQQPGPLTLTMWQFLTEMQETKKGVVTPKELFSQVCKKAIRFRGYQQQDSQELLRYLLDGMRGEEIQRASSAISKTLQDASAKIEDDEVKKIVKDCEKRRAIPNFVDRLFGGELTSTIMCETCHTVSLVHEPFLDLSLPVLDDTPAKKNTTKTAKAVPEKKNMEEDDDDSYVKDRQELTSGPSKHLQKKAKKQAKKQAKNQRRQQKILGKTLLLNDSLESQPDGEGDNVPENGCKEQEQTSPDGPSPNVTNELDGPSSNVTSEMDSPSSNVTNELDGPSSNVTNEMDGPSSNVTSEMDGPSSNVTNALDDSSSNVTSELDGPSFNVTNEMDGPSSNVTSELDGPSSNVTNEMDGPSSNVTSEMDGLSSEITNEKEDEVQEDIENKELCIASLGNPQESTEPIVSHQSVAANADHKELESQSVDNPSVKNEVLCSEKMENGDTAGTNINSNEVLDEAALQIENDAVENQLTESLNRLNLISDLQPDNHEIHIIDKAPPSPIYEVVNQDPKTAFCTLSDRNELHLDEWSVLSCLYQFTRKEDLVGNNQLLCNTCTQRQAKAPRQNNKVEKKFVYSNAKKQMLVSAPPPILTLHLKRFQQNGFNLHKINKLIKFPEVIDLAPFCTLKCKSIMEGESQLLYALYGVIEHSGTMRSGHYTAYVKSRIPNPRLRDLVLQGVLPEEPSTEPTKGLWFHISDSQVQAVPLSKVLSCQAYLLFYERIL
ncbi:ubiquitin carboxyl-terminal hydrolase 16 [Gastrophryne carolinensis]